jgi:dolichol-phosphate mannosyltransferase
MIYVIFPAYNEERVIGSALASLASTARGREGDYHAVLIDDGSTDHTVAEAVRVAGAEKLSLTVLRHETNRGLGAGLRTGIYWCLDRAAPEDVIVTLDADGTHPTVMIPRMVERLAEGCDLVIASRYRPGASVRGVPPHRRALSDLARIVFQVMYPIPGVRDYTCCFRAFRASLLDRARRAYGDALCSERGFEAVTDLLLRLAPLGFKACEIGFTLDYSGRAGASKMKVMRTIRKTLVLLARRRWERMIGSPKPAAMMGAAAQSGIAAEDTRISETRADTAGPRRGAS